MKATIDEVISLLEKSPFEGTSTVGGRTVIRIKPDDCAVVSITTWLLHRDGNTCPEGTDILTKRKTEYGQNILYVKFRKPDTDALSNDQTIYRISL